jgi:FtsZ-interacting cell division protein ZipA
MDDLVILMVIIVILMVLIILLYVIENKEYKEDKVDNKMNNQIKRAKIDMQKLEEITENIERDYKPSNIELTSYEKEQEQSAIISYQELLKNRDNQQTINIDKVSIDPEDMPLPSFKVNLMNYEKEEAFLKALKQLQSDLAR